MSQPGSTTMPFDALGESTRQRAPLRSAWALVTASYMVVLPGVAIAAEARSPSHTHAVPVSSSNAKSPGGAASSGIRQHRSTSADSERAILPQRSQMMGPAAVRAGFAQTRSVWRIPKGSREFATVVRVDASRSAQFAASSRAVKPISRARIVERARSWVTQGVPYSQLAWWSDQNGTYRQDCSGFVSMAWELDARENYWTGNLASVSTPIAAADMQEGDILLSASHTVIFAGWTDEARSRFALYEQASGAGARYVSSASLQNYVGNGYTAYRRVALDGYSGSSATKSATEGYSATAAASPPLLISGSSGSELAGSRVDTEVNISDDVSPDPSSLAPQSEKFVKPTRSATPLAQDDQSHASRVEEGTAQGLAGVAIVICAIGLGYSGMARRRERRT